MTPEERAALEAEATALEARISRFRAWYHAQAATMEALTTQVRSASEGAMSTLTAQRDLIDRGTRKADALSARLTAIRLKLQEQTQQEKP